MRAKLLVVGGRASSSEIELKLPLTIGRGDQVWLRLKHPTISRKHCEISEVDGKLVVRDCGSANGTLVDGEPITEAVLEPGHTLTVGPLTFEAQYQPSSNGHGEVHPAEDAERPIDPAAATMLGMPEGEAIAPPEENAASLDEDDFSLSLDSESLSLDDSLSLGDEEDLAESLSTPDNEGGASDDAVLMLDEADFNQGEASAAPTTPETVEPEAESEFELDFDLDDEPEVEASSVADAEAAAEAETPDATPAEIAARDEPGMTIEADSDALSNLEAESDFELDLNLNEPSEIDESPAPEPEASSLAADKVEDEASEAVDDAAIEGIEEEDDASAAVIEDIENVRDFSGPLVDMPSQILFSVDEIDEPLIDVSEEDSAVEEAVGETTEEESASDLELESLAPETKQPAEKEEAAVELDAADDPLALEDDDFALSEPTDEASEKPIAMADSAEASIAEETDRGDSPADELEPELDFDDLLEEPAEAADATKAKASPEKVAMEETKLEPLSLAPEDQDAEADEPIAMADSTEASVADTEDSSSAELHPALDFDDLLDEPSDEIASIPLDEVEDKPVVDETKLEPLDLMSDVEDEAPEANLKPLEEEDGEDSFELSLDDDEDTADGDLSDITDAAEAAQKAAPAGEAVEEDSLSDLDLAFDDEDTADSESFAELELLDEDAPATAEPASAEAAQPESAEEDSFEIEDELSDDLDDFSDSAELQWPDAALTPPEPEGEKSDEESDLDLSEMALDSPAKPEPSDSSPKQEVPAADSEANSAEDELDLSELALDAIDSPDDAMGRPGKAAAESEAPDLDLSEMALEALDSPSSESLSDEPALDAGDEESDDLDLSEMAFEAVEDATGDDDARLPVEAEAEDEADSLDLSELALGELGEPSPTAETSDELKDALPLAEDESDAEAEEIAAKDSDEADPIAGFEIEAAEEIEFEDEDLDELDAAVEEVDFSASDDDEEVSSINLDFDADSQADDLDLSETAFDVGETSKADDDLLDFPEVDFNSDDDSSEADDSLPAFDAEAVADDDSTPAHIDNELSSHSDELELPEFTEEAADDANADDAPLIEVDAEQTSDVDSADFSEFDFSSDEDASSMGEASLEFELPAEASAPSSSGSDVSAAAADSNAEKAPKKKRGWWPFGRKKKAEPESAEAANTVDEVQLPGDAIESVAEDDAEEFVQFEVEDAESDAEVFDAAELLDEDEPEFAQEVEEIAELDFEEPSDSATPELPEFETAESAAVEDDDASSDLVGDLMFEDEDSEVSETPAIAADESSAPVVSCEDAEDELGMFEAVEEIDEAEEVEEQAPPNIAAASDEAEVLDLPSFAEDDDDSSEVSFEAVEIVDDEDETSAEVVAEADDELDEASLFEAVDLVEEDEPELAAEVVEDDELDLPSFDDDDSSSVVHFDAVEADAGSGEALGEIEAINFDEESAEITASSAEVEQPPTAAKTKRGWWPFGKKPAAEPQAKQKAETPKKKRGWGLGKKKAVAEPTDEAVAKPTTPPAAAEPQFDEQISFEAVNDDDDSMIAPSDSADDDAMSFLVDSDDAHEVDDADDVPDFAALDEDNEVSSDDDSDEFLKQLDL